MQLLGTTINRNPENGFLSVTGLTKAYELNRKQYEWSEPNLTSIMQSNNFKIHLYNYLTSQNIVNTSMLEFNASLQDINITKYLKSLDLWKTTGRGPSRKVFCHEKIFKKLCMAIFGSHYYGIETDWLKEINIQYLTPAKRDASLEKLFLTALTDKVGFLANEVKRQYQLNKYFYDLYINIFDKKLLIEYHEEQHLSTHDYKNDKIKCKIAEERFFYYIPVIVGKEKDGLDCIKDIISGKLSIEDLKEINYFRFNSIAKKYTKDINKGIIGKHLPHIRNIATHKNLLKIAEIENFIKKAPAAGFTLKDHHVADLIQNVANQPV